MFKSLPILIQPQMLRRIGWGAASGRLLCLCISILPMTAGCSMFGSGKVVQQLQNENDRLLSEFRAERQRRDEAERANKILEARLAESEKLLARQSQGASRLSSLQNGNNYLGTSAPPPTVAPDAFTPDGDQESGVQWQRRVK